MCVPDGRIVADVADAFIAEFEAEYGIIAADEIDAAARRWRGGPG